MNFHPNNILSSKEVADYCELISQYLDNIPIKTEEDFNIVACALSSLAKLEEVKGDSNLQGRISAVKEILDCPEMYVVKEKEEAFKNLVKERIAAKVHELTSLSFQEKKVEIEKHVKKEAIVKENQSKLSEKEAPQVGSEAHTISEEEYLRELQNNFNHVVNLLSSILSNVSTGNREMPPLEGLFAPLYIETIEPWRRVIQDPNGEAIELWRGVMQETSAANTSTHNSRDNRRPGGTPGGFIRG